MSELAAARGMQFDYPAIEGVEADLLLVTHEHIDHNGVEAIGGSPQILRSTAGDPRIARRRGDRHRLRARRCRRHAARPQHDLLLRRSTDCASATSATSASASSARSSSQAIGEVDLLFLPVGDGATIGATAGGGRSSNKLRPRWVVPMHYRTPRIGFLEPADAFLGLFDEVNTLATAAFDTDELDSVEGPPVVLVPAVP
jgi:hypothetical protein